MESIYQPDSAHLLLRFSEAVDQRRPELAAACFMSDGLFRPGDRAIIGSHDILEFYRERLADPLRKTRHVWANISTVGIEPGAVRVTALLTNYAFEPSVCEDSLQMRIGNVECRVERDADGEWRFAEHLYDRAFVVSLPLGVT